MTATIKLIGYATKRRGTICSLTSRTAKITILIAHIYLNLRYLIIRVNKAYFYCIIS